MVALDPLFWSLIALLATWAAYVAESEKVSFRGLCKATTHVAMLFVVFGWVKLAVCTTNVTRFVNTTCTSFNGDGSSNSCAASNGAAGAYNSLANAVSDVKSDYSNDLVAADVNVTILCSGSTADATSVTIATLTTDATRYLTVQAATGQEAGAKYDATRYHMENSEYFNQMLININYMDVKNIQIVNHANDDAHATLIGINNGSTGRMRVTGNLLLYDPTGTPSVSSSHTCIVGFPAANTEIDFVNNVVMGCNRTSVSLNTTSTGDKFIIYNNTIRPHSSPSTGSALNVDCSGSSETVRVRNNLLLASGTTAYSRASTCSTYSTQANSTSDTSSPDGAGFQSKTFTFANTSSFDSNLSASDTGAKDLGSDLSADGDYAFSTDINRVTRTGSWDVGAAEYVISTNTAAVHQILMQLGVH